MKCVLVDEEANLLFSKYKRHNAKISQTALEMLSDVEELFPDEKVGISISGSAGMGIAEKLDIPFVQEVFATRVAANRLTPGTDCIIELGGEDAKILFLTGGTEVRMNGSCAGGTGAFIDQMATLLKMSAEEMNLVTNNWPHGTASTSANVQFVGQLDKESDDAILSGDTDVAGATTTDGQAAGQ